MITPSRWSISALSIDTTTVPSSCKFAGVANQIQRYLPYPGLIRMQDTDAFRAINFYLVTVGESQRFGGDLNVTNKCIQIEILQVHIDLTGFYLGQIEDFIDQVQQVLARISNTGQRFDLIFFAELLCVFQPTFR